MTTGGPLVTVVVPVREEGEGVVPTLEAIRAHVPEPREVVVVLDEPGETTLRPVRRLVDAGFAELRAERNRYRQGPSGALRTGFEVAAGTYTLVTMGDGSDALEDVPTMLALAEQGCDVVCGSRYAPGGRQLGGPPLKRTLARLAGVSLQRVAGVPTCDVTNSFKLYRTERVRATRIESTAGFEIGMELTLKAFADGGRVAEVPTTWRDRDGGRSRFRFVRWLPGYVRWYLYGLAAGRLRRGRG